ncbi:hypothetical protein GCM10009655_11060 [Rhodoglobus aureus]|uniref:Uncharacterized protein n=1 Tax=Rhodoglobus aureus TaxID=191497 RepID=A0ABN1VJ06_9MICO
MTSVLSKLLVQLELGGSWARVGQLGEPKLCEEWAPRIIKSNSIQTYSADCDSRLMDAGERTNQWRDDSDRFAGPQRTPITQ